MTQKVSSAPDPARAEQAESRLQAALALLGELAAADCGCSWEQDEVGDGGGWVHDENCLHAQVAVLAAQQEAQEEGSA